MLDPAVEYRIKGAYLFNFTRFVSWPSGGSEAEDDAFVIAVIDPIPGAPAAQTIAAALKQKTAGSRPIVVKSHPSLPRELEGVRLIFLTAPARDQLDAARRRIGDRPVLLVGETSGFAEDGGTINLVVTGDNVRCEINLRQAERAGLKLSGRLANVSRLVREERIRE